MKGLLIQSENDPVQAFQSEGQLYRWFQAIRYILQQVWCELWDIND